MTEHEVKFLFEISEGSVRVDIGGSLVLCCLLLLPPYWKQSLWTLHGWLDDGMHPALHNSSPQLRKLLYLVGFDDQWGLD